MEVSATLPTLYEHYTTGGITAGLSTSQPHFTLNNRNVTLYSGAMHYFRVPREYWRDRLRKMRAAGLNAVETYIPWNLHEPTSGRFDFGDGGNDMSQFLDVKDFLTAVQEEDLFAIVRPGPYICTEWEFGGFPSWLLRVDGIKLRTSQGKYMEFVQRYFNVLLPLLAAFQFTKGGSVIAFQVENEYGSTYEKDKFTPDREYLRQLRQLFLRNGIEELLFTSDGVGSYGERGTLPEVLFETCNFANDPEKEFDALKKFQPKQPFMAMEFWTGWFDHWSEQHHTRNNNEFKDVLDRILQYPASVNMYMFVGGTNWGFMNGANVADSSTDNKGYQPDTTSYDYDSPISESGDYTEKYVITKELIKKHNKILTKLPLTPTETERKAYESIPVQQQLSFKETLDLIDDKFDYVTPVPMELLPFNNNSGQSYGYVVYRKENVSLRANAVLKISGRVCDTVMVLVNGRLISKPLLKLDDLNHFGYWRENDSTITLTTTALENATVELIVENWGRVNFGKLDQFVQFKGLWQGDVYVDDVALRNWQIVPVEFKKAWNEALRGWHAPCKSHLPEPALYRVVLETQDVKDTFLDMREWTKGVVVVNGFVLGRYARIGPQQTLYLPAPFLKVGKNEVVVFEHFTPGDSVKFSENAIYSSAK